MSEWLQALRYLLLAGLFLFLHRVIRAVTEDVRAAALRGGTPWAVLLVEEGSGPQPGDAFAIHGSIVVGSAADSNVILHEAAASARHLRVVARGDGYWVEDLGSSAGTYLNDRRLEAPAPLRHGDRLRVGSTVLRFVEAREA